MNSTYVFIEHDYNSIYNVNMLNKTFLHIFDVEVLFNLCAKSNFTHDFTK